MKTARFVLSCHSVGTFLPEIALSARMSASLFAGSPRCAFTLTRNITAPAVVLFRSSLIASNKMSASCDHTKVAFPLSPTHLLALGYRTNKAKKLSQGCLVMPIQRPLVPNCSSWILPLRVPPSICCLLLSSFSQVHIPCSHFPPCLVRSITRCDCASEAVIS